MAIRILINTFRACQRKKTGNKLKQYSNHEDKSKKI